MKIKEIVTLGDLKLNLEELTAFIVWAKKQGYAGGGDYKLIKGCSKQFACQRGDFYFSDRYKGELQFAGHETVRLKTELGQPIWVMNYFGGVLPEFLGDEKIAEQTEKVLKPSLMQVTSEFPFRGPRSYNILNVGFYENEFIGNIRRFFGEEEINLKKVKKEEWKNGGSHFIAYSLNYHGGLIIPK